MKLSTIKKITLLTVLIGGSSPSVYPLTKILDCTTIPQRYNQKIISNGACYYLGPGYTFGRVDVKGGFKVQYSSATAYLCIPPYETGANMAGYLLTISNLPYVSNSEFTYSGPVLKKAEPFKYIISAARGQRDLFIESAITVTYGEKFLYENDNQELQYTLLTDETAKVDECIYTTQSNQNVYNRAEIVIPSILPFEKNGFYDVTVTKIDNKAFSDLSELEKITLPATIESIGSGAFSGSSNLATVIIDATVPPTLSADAFDVTAVQNVAVYVPAESYLAYKTAPVWRDLNIIPSGDAVAMDGVGYKMADGMAVVTAFDSDAETVSVPSIVAIDGKDCAVAIELLPISYPNLKSIYIGEDVEIKAFSAKNVPNLKKVFYSGTSAPSISSGAMTSLSGQNIQVYGINEEAIAPIVTQTNGTPRIYAMLKNMFTADGIVYIPTSTAGRTCDAVDYDYSTPAPVLGETATYRNIMFSIKNINPYIFHQAKSVESIIINNLIPLPNSFAQATGVRTLELNCGDISAEAFINNTSLSKLSIGGKGNIGQSAFAGSGTALTTAGAEIEINNEGSIGNSAFKSFGPIDKLHIGENVTGVETSAFEGAFSAECEGVVQIECNGSLGAKAFYNTRNIRSLTIVPHVSGIGENAFRYAMVNATATAIINNSGAIGENAFRNNNALTSVKIGDYCTAIKSLAFTVNSQLKEVSVGDGCTEIGNQAFNNNVSLEKIVLGDGVKTVGNEVFKGDTALKDVTFGSGLTSLGNYVFDNCEAMASLTVKAVIPPVCGTYDFRHIDTWSCELLVPRKSVDAYAKAPQWNEFMNLAAYSDPNEVTDIVVDPESGLGDLFADGLALFVGDSKEVSLKVVPDTAQAELTWSSSDNEVVTVGDGLIVAVGAGEATVTVTAGDVSREFAVKVSKREQSISWEQEFVGVTEGSVVELTATATSGLDVEYTVIAGSASVTDATLFVDEIGAITVEASQPGNNEYLAAKSLRRTLNALSGVDFVSADGSSYRIEGRELQIVAGDFRLYNLQGILVESGSAPKCIALLPGETFILHLNGKAIKLMVF